MVLKNWFWLILFTYLICHATNIETNERIRKVLNAPNYRFIDPCLHLASRFVCLNDI